VFTDTEMITVTVIGRKRSLVKRGRLSKERLVLTMDYKEFIRAAEDKFGLGLMRVACVKCKAGHEMIEWRDVGTVQSLYEDTIIGPDAGYRLHYTYWGISVSGWAYLLKDGEWYLQRDGVFEWRRGSNPFPDIHRKDVENRSFV